MKLVIELELDGLSRDYRGRPVIDGTQVGEFLRMIEHRVNGRVLDTPSDGAGTSDAGRLARDQITTDRVLPRQIETVGWWELQNDPLTDPWDR